MADEGLAPGGVPGAVGFLAMTDPEHTDTPRGPGTRYDWTTIRETYVEGHMDAREGIKWLTLKEVAELHDMPYRTLRKRSANEGWPEARAAFQAQLERARFAEKAAAAAREMADMDSKALVAAKAGMALTLRRLQEITQAQDPNAAGVQVLDQIDAKELNTLASSAKSWRELAANALGVPTEVTALEVSGPGGTNIDIREELMADGPDHERLRGLLGVLERSGLAVVSGGPGVDSGGSDAEAVDA